MFSKVSSFMKHFLTKVNFCNFFCNFLSETVRKLLQADSRDESTVHGHNNYPRGEEHDSKTLSTPIGVAAAGAMLACCVFLCPCFFRKRKDASHAVLAKDPNSSESNLIILYLAICNICKLNLYHKLFLILPFEQSSTSSKWLPQA